MKWEKNLCSRCNNARSQSFDIAYDTFEHYYLSNIDALIGKKRLVWADVFGEDWQPASRDLARYFGKQVGCMLSGQQLPVPTELIQFLDGGEHCSSMCFMIIRIRDSAEAHRRLKSDGGSGLESLIRIPTLLAYKTDEVFSGVEFRYQLGYVVLTADWYQGESFSSWFEHAVIDLPWDDDLW